MPVVCPLQRGVSRQTSASCPLLTCSSLGATGEKMIRFWARPKFCAYCWILGSPTAGKRSSHSTLLGTLFRICNKNKKQIQKVQRGTFMFLNKKLPHTKMKWKASSFSTLRYRAEIKQIIITNGIIRTAFLIPLKETATLSNSSQSSSSESKS